MDLGLDGRVALVVGASKGLGFASAAELAREGARVAIASRSRESIDAAAAQIGATGFVWDTSDVAGAPALVDEVEASLGAPVDILVCNTGGPPAGDPLGPSADEWRAAYESLVLAPMELVKRCLPEMRSRGWGRIVNIVSTTVREPSPFLMLSNSHRAATVAAWKTLAGPAASDGVTINSVLPGRIATQRLGELFGSLENAEAGAAADVAMGRLGTPEEFAAAVAFLCSERASYITGVALLVDGGVTKAI